MSVYLDTNVVVSLFVEDSFSARAQAFMAGGTMDIVVSDLVSAEFSSVIGVYYRTKEINLRQARSTFFNFDSWRRSYAIAAETVSGDIRAAEAMLRRLDLTLRTPDAVHIAIARRLDAELVTFDKRMAADARQLGDRVTVPA